MVNENPFTLSFGKSPIELVSRFEYAEKIRLCLHNIMRYDKIPA